MVSGKRADGRDAIGMVIVGALRDQITNVGGAVEIDTGNQLVTGGSVVVGLDGGQQVFDRGADLIQNHHFGRLRKF